MVTLTSISMFLKLNLSHSDSRIMALLKPLLAFLAILLTFLLFATLTEQQIVRDLVNGLSYANFGKHEKFRLNAGQLENTSAYSSSQCCAKCLPNKSCFSVNYGGIGRNECQLLSANKFQSSDQMTIDKTFEHFSVVVSTIFVQLRSTLTLCENFHRYKTESKVSRPVELYAR